MANKTTGMPVNGLSPYKATLTREQFLFYEISPPNLIDQDLKQLLDAVSFTDRIIFGRTNYSPKVTQYRANKAFYNEKAQEVIEYCNKHKIDYHIKDKTMTE